ncbi:hypothetical protein [Pontimicrobium sp. IMCC45349]|uniref:hypothetical protein n=1 Tax=Pontimicrobium sp. IMCC45349 TaxID=3391574 RepID=UPI0039A0DF75
MRITKVLLHLCLIIILTVLTQVGGLIWLLALLLSKKYQVKKRFIFPILYFVFNLIIIPSSAKLLGREQLPIFDEQLKPRNLVYPILFRNYVNPELKDLLMKASKETNIKITYLDANFPFFDGFPLLPHLSHNDGKKIDLSFMYLDEYGIATNKKPSISGYGVFSNSENNKTSKSCIDQGYWQYDYPKYLTFGTINKLSLNKNSTKQLIQKLLKSSKTEKLFIEPHLKQSLGLNNEMKIRFHGCRAVRHDDHIHLQIK